MSAEDKAKNLAEKAGGAIKQTAGRVTGDESLEASGAKDQTVADLKQSGEKLKDGLRDASE
jgi:uncharacterized protein YjbJ (UPF0337 family)